MSVTNTRPKNINRYNIQSWHSHSDERDKCFCTESSWWVIPSPGKYSTRLPTFLKYLPSHSLPVLHGTMQCLLHDTTFEAFTAVLVRTPVFWLMSPCRWSTDTSASYDDVGSRFPRNGGYLYINPYSVISHNTVFKENPKSRFGKSERTGQQFWGFVIKFPNTRCVIARASIVGIANRYGLYGPGIDS